VSAPRSSLIADSQKRLSADTSDRETFQARAWRLAQRGRAISDLKTMAWRESALGKARLLAGAAAAVIIVSLVGGGPWPLLPTALTVGVVLLVTSSAAWKSSFFVGLVAIAFGAAPLWVAAGVAIGLLLRRRRRWAARRSRPRSLASSTPIRSRLSAGLRRGIPLHYGLMRLRRGNRDGARDLFTFVVQRKPRRGDRAARAAAHIGLARLARENSDITLGLAHAAAATKLLSTGRPRLLTGKLLFERGLLLRDGARNAEAAHVLEAAYNRLRRRDPMGAVAALTAQASSLVGDPMAALRVAVTARENAVRAGDLNGLIRTELLLAQTAAAAGDEDLAESAARSVLLLAEDGADSYAKTTDEDLQAAITEQAAAQGKAHLVLAQALARSQSVEQAMEQAEAAVWLCDNAGQSYEAAAAELIMTDLLEQLGRQAAALRHALAVVAHLDRSRYLLPTPRWRTEWIRSNEAAYAHALRLATVANEGRLLAELVEAARLQAIPRADDLPTAGSGQDVLPLPNQEMGGPPVNPGAGDTFRRLDVNALRAAAAQAALGSDPLQPSPIVTIDGQRFLPRAEVGPGLLRVDIGEQVRRMAGADAWWWGGAIADGTYYWAVRVAGHFTCGSTSIKSGTAGAEALAALLDATPGPGSQEQGLDGVLAGPLSGRVLGGDDPRLREREFSWRLSATFLPPPLRQYALQHLGRMKDTSRVTPALLVVSLPAALCRLPVALLPLDRSPNQDSDLPRLVEAATLYHAPSMALLASTGGRPPEVAPSNAQPWPLLVAVVDPTDDLKHADGGDEPHVLLTGSHRLGQLGQQSGSRAQLATKNALRTALLNMPSRGGLLVYAGHAHPGHPDAPATGGLVLAAPSNTESGNAPLEGDTNVATQQLLTARELLVPEKGQPAFRFPAKVLLSACSTSGYGTSPQVPGLAGEWLGVAAAVLHAGADEVVATLFDVIDVRATTRFERHLVTLLRTTPDASSALRQAQIEALDEWRRGRRMPPLIWAAYICMGGSSVDRQAAQC
jgi:CHAT domain